MISGQVLDSQRVFYLLFLLSKCTLAGLGRQLGFDLGQLVAVLLSQSIHLFLVLLMQFVHLKFQSVLAGLYFLSIGLRYFQLIIVLSKHLLQLLLVQALELVTVALVFHHVLLALTLAFVQLCLQACSFTVKLFQVEILSEKLLLESLFLACHLIKIVN